jgi:mono/diheme cytochrome c family protein
MIRIIFAAGLVGSVLFQGLAWAHGSQKHQDSGQRKQHMEDMVQLKNQIPEDFQVMNRTPVIPDEMSLQSGKKAFTQFCTACHGQDGRGDGPAAGGMNPQPANFHDLEHSGIYGPGEKFWIITNGSGKTGMPGFANELSIQTRWDLVNYIYRLQGQTR